MARLLGSIDPLPSGKYRYRVVVASKLSSTTVLTLQEALELQRAVSDRATSKPAQTLGDYGVIYLDWRETVQKARAIGTDRSRWKTHVAPTMLARLPLHEVTTRRIEVWAERLQGSVQTKRHALNLLRRCLDRARRERLIASNPALGVRVDGSDPDAWTYLSAAEQRTLTTSLAVPAPERLIIAFAIGTGLRQGEQWSLRLVDVHLDDDEPCVVVRFGSPTGPTKTGKPRRIPLLPWVAEVLRVWLDQLPAYLTGALRRDGTRKVYDNEAQLVFPTRRGCRRRDKKPPRGWSDWLDKTRVVGVTGSPVVWHSLRHTCASMLVSGTCRESATAFDAIMISVLDSRLMLGTAARFRAWGRLGPDARRASTGGNGSACAGGRAARGRVGGGRTSGRPDGQARRVGVDR
jgi:integrase